MQTRENKPGRQKSSGKFSTVITNYIMWNLLIGKPVANPALMRSRLESGQMRGGK